MFARPFSCQHHGPYLHAVVQGAGCRRPFSYRYHGHVFLDAHIFLDVLPHTLAPSLTPLPLPTCRRSNHSEVDAKCALSKP